MEPLTSSSDTPYVDWDVFKNRQQEHEETQLISTTSNPPTPTTTTHTHSTCSHQHWIYDFQNGAKICSQCGLIGKKNLIDSTPEWRNIQGNNQFSSDPCRVGVINPLLPQSSLSTRIVTKYGKKNNLAKMNRWQAMPYAERSMYDVFTMMENKCKHVLNKAVLTSAKQFFLKVYKLNISLSEKGEKREGLRGGKRYGLIGACLFYAAKQNNCPTTELQISKMLGIKKSDVTRGCNIFMDLIKKDKKCSIIINENTDGNYYIKEYGAVLGLDYQIIKFAIDFYKLLEKKNLFGGNTPPSIAAGSLYIILQNLNTHVTESYIANKCKVSKVTILNVNKHLQEYKYKLLVSVFVKDYCKRLNIANKLSLWKMKKLGKYITYLDVLNSYHPRLIAYASIFIILYFSNRLEEFEERLKKTVHWKDNDLNQILKVLLFYKDDIVNRFFKEIYVPVGAKKIICDKRNVYLDPPTSYYSLYRYAILKKKELLKRKSEECQENSIKRIKII